MITRISGILERVGPHAAVVATEAGLAYEVLIPAALATELAASDGQRVTFQTVQLFEPVGGGNALRPRLIGFLSESDRRFYELFTTVKGVGGRRALRAMAAPAARLARAIEDNDAAFLRGMPEIGKRLAETVIAELHGKVDEFLLSDSPGGAIAEVKPGGALDAAGEQAVEALVRLGQPRPEAEKAVGKAMERLPDAPSPDEILAAAFAGVAVNRLLAWWEMARLVLSGRYRPGSRYWEWRRETAFGGPRRLSRAERSRALREFALWTRAMRRHTGS